MIKIDLPSRYENIVSSLEHTMIPHTFSLSTNSEVIRVIYKENSKDIQSIDLQGGPMISVGNKDLIEGRTLKQIVEVNNQFRFIFERNEDKE